MTDPRRQRASIAAVLLAISAAVVISFATASEGATPPNVTASGVGAIKLGKTYTSLRLAGLLGKVTRGCELAGPNTRSAPLNLPLQGGVELSAGTPRRVRGITVFGGAKARGVGSGAKLAAIREAFPRMRLDHSGDKTLGITVAQVPKGGGGPLEFAISVQTKTVTLIGIPRVAICE